MGPDKVKGLEKNYFSQLDYNENFINFLASQA
jgi:hypothetical protein